MAVPARHTSKAKKNKRRTHYKLTAPSVQFDETTEITHVHTVYHLKDTTKDVKSLKLTQLNNRREIPCA